MGNIKTFRVEFTVETRKGSTKRVALEGKRLESLLKKIKKRDGYNVLTSYEV